MAQPTERGGIYWLRKKVPLDLRPHEGKTEEKFSLKTRDPVQARVLFAKANAEIEERWARLRQGLKSPLSLTHKEAYAIAGEIRDRFKYKSNDLWEALATIDYAMLALDHDGIRPTSAAVLSYIAADDEWHPKIEKLRLTEASIHNVMIGLESLFTDTGG